MRFKTVAQQDANPSPAEGSHLINDRKSLPVPYGPAELPPDLAAVVASWPTLPEAIKAGIMAMVKAATRLTQTSDCPEAARLALAKASGFVKPLGAVDHEARGNGPGRWMLARRGPATYLRSPCTDSTG
jgi:hypothetical protein